MGTDKAMLDWHGQPLVLHVASRLAQVADPVVLASGAPGRLGGIGYTTVADPVPGAGPLAGLVAALHMAPQPLVAAVAVDLPDADPWLLRRLAAACAGRPAAIPVTADGREQVLHAVYALDAADALAGALERGERSLRRALAGLDVALLVEDDDRFARNLNRPEDLFDVT